MVHLSDRWRRHPARGGQETIVWLHSLLRYGGGPDHRRRLGPLFLVLQGGHAARQLQPAAATGFEPGKLYTTTFVVGGVEQVKKADGTAVPAVRVTPDVRDQAGKRTAVGSVLWLSNGAALKPVRMEASLPVGRIVLALK